MLLSTYIWPTKLEVIDEPTNSNPISLRLWEKESVSIMLHLSYPEALDLARQLRLACGVEMGSATE